MDITRLGCIPQTKGDYCKCSSSEILQPRGGSDSAVWCLRHRLGCSTSAGGRPIAFASRGLTQTLKVEKEFLAIQHGNVPQVHIWLQSYHEPLETIVRKPLLTSPKRLQRIMLCIEKFDLDVAYMHGRELTDTLSRSELLECPSFSSVEADIDSNTPANLQEQALCNTPCYKTG